MCFLKRIMKKKIDYVSTYEVTTANDGRYHQHIHLIIIGVGFLPKKQLHSCLRNGKKYQTPNTSISNTYQKTEM